MIKEFLQEELQTIMDHMSSEEILSCHIHPLFIEGRLQILKENFWKSLIIKRKMGFNELNSVEHYIIHQLSGPNLNNQEMP